MTTKSDIHRVRDLDWLAFPGRLWQRNTYDRIIRDDAELQRIRLYIAANPQRWALAEANPARG